MKGTEKPQRNISPSVMCASGFTRCISANRAFPAMKLPLKLKTEFDDEINVLFGIV